MISNIGAGGLVLFFNIIFLIVGLLIMYLVISKAVKDGINKSVIGEFVEKKYKNSQDNEDLNK
ncbi:hypothetical protein M670_04449 [Schinkia azotoformans MEV2011]|uniref:Uncharacterized protein n=1 Tax=Schinkia azotoformans MEV2011 TaxID=1348973 RepID=A0A072NGI9_SCHAZ|nr:hypothetical protein [Schinkia azotoformans]KEF36377.1 hypothetical protein M670_04449 [Schinkia azotoformans MEV2011]MEC1697317.1 hypothetical protein [Schinkia azotoformans]MEC1716263.1 hypothetical protein [Schinkia azotoformans]MEC1724599.1 hypothetical protein [Schinkia azotoformans]MEC1741640.1 hypothetical protein [Schinkia azotoformans]